MDKRILAFNKLKSAITALGISASLIPFLFFFPNSMILAAIIIMLEGKIVFDSSSFFKIFSELTKEMRIELESKEWKELSFKYNDILHKMISLMEHLEVESPIEIYALYVYLYRNGYLSYNKEFVYADNDVKDILNLYGIDVIRGRGCCRNISHMLENLYNIKSFNSYMFSCLSSTDSLETDINLSIASLKKDLEEQIAKDEFLKKMLPLQSYIGNHLINCVKINDNICWLDPTNDLLLYKQDKKLYPALSDEALMSKIRLFNIDNTNQFTKKEYFSGKNMTFEEYKTIYEKTNRIINANQDVFERFYLDNKDSYEEIFELMEKYPFANTESVKSKKLIY